jgi:alpha-glucosidase (family GH31 glycosyl hydrolase)
MVKNTQEKVQDFDKFKRDVKNWEIDECLVLEMWDDQEDQQLNSQEMNFQRMLVNNMETVFKIFFRGMATKKFTSRSLISKNSKQFQTDLQQLERQRHV